MSDVLATPGELGARLDERVWRRLAPLLWATSAAFAFFTAVTLVMRPPGATVPLALVDGAGTVILAVAALLAKRVPVRWANATVAVALLLTLGASLFAIKVLQLPSQTTNVMLVALVGSVVLLSAAWTAVMLGVSLVGWAAVAWSEGFGEAWLNAGFALVATSIMGAMIQFVRLREARMTEMLVAQNEDKARRLESAVHAEKRHSHDLAAMNDSLEAFSYVIAHDLKEPLRSTRLLLDEALETRDPAERLEMVERAARSHEQLARLVHGLLEWSRATTEPLEPKDVHLGELLDDPMTRQTFDRALQERRARLLLDTDLPPVLGTPPLLRQVFGNLILNAIRHADRPEPQIRVFAAHDTPKGFADIVIQDEGPGFSAQFLEKDRHRVGDPSPRSIKGGFGIAIARRAAQRLGGEIHLGNRAEGRGAEVHVILPLTDAARAARMAAAPRRD